jgi:hypothetical protein
MDYCEITGTVNAILSGGSVSGGYLNVHRVSKAGELIPVIMAPVRVVGSTITFSVPRDSVIYTSGNIEGFWKDSNGKLYNASNPKALTVPNTANANLADLVSISVVPDEGVTVRDNNTAHGLPIGDFDFVGFTVTYPSAGRVRITDTGGVGASALADLTDVSLTSLAANDFLKWNGTDWINRTIAQVKSDLSLNLVENAAASGLYQTLANKATDFSTVNNTLYPTVAAVKTYADTAIANLVDSSPSTLDTLNELAAALGNDPNFATTVTTSIATKLAKASNLSDLTDAATARTNLGLAIGSNVQAYSADLTAIAGLSLTNDDILQRKAGAWTNRTLAQLKSDLSLNLVENTALSTWAGSANLTTLGTIATGSWNATAIAWAKVDKTGSSLADLATRSAGDLNSGTLPLARLSGITNTEISNSAAIAYSKLNLTGAILNADLAGSIALSKLSITGTPDGTKFLRDDGVWAAAGGGGGTPGGSDTQIQFNDGGSFGGDSGLVFNKTTNALIHTSNSATAFESGPNGSTNPVFRLVNNTASQATGLSITGGTATTVLGAISSGSDANIQLTPKGNGFVQVNRGGSAGSPTFYPANVGSGFFSPGGSTIGFSFGGTESWRWQDADTMLVLSNSGKISYGSSLDITLARAAAASFKAYGTDAVTNAITNSLILGHNSSGTPAAGFGSGLKFQLESSTTEDQDAGQIAAEWEVSTHASRTSNLVFKTVNNAAALAEAFRLKGDLSAVFAGIPRFNGTNSTGAGSALLGSNSPASTLSAPYTWISVVTSDGSSGFVPVWK